jgi:hypothetical protein
MWQGLANAEVPGWSRSPRAWRRSWLLGYVSSVVSRVRAAEQAAQASETKRPMGEGQKLTLVLADRRQVIHRNITAAYPETRKTQMTYSGSGYGAGHAAGQEAQIGGRGVGRKGQGAITGR